MRIEIWSDIVCPWCYIGKRHFEHALARFEGRDDVEIVWRSFELDPSAPAERTGDLWEHLARKYRVSVEQARAMGQRVTDAAAKAGLDFRFEGARSGNTFDAHRLLHFAAEHGRGDALKERLLHAYFSENLLPSDHEALAALAADVGLDAEATAEVLLSDAYAEAVRADERKAREVGVRGVPFFVLDDTFAISGAQPAETFLKALEIAASKRAERLETSADAACDPEEGCAIPETPSRPGAS